MSDFQFLYAQSVRELASHFCHYVERCPAVGLVENENFTFLWIHIAESLLVGL
jgi:hypothetical protein